MCDHEHHHHHSKKSPVIKIIVATLIFASAMIIQPAESVRFLAFLAAYIIAGGDIVLKAVKNILKGEVFDENFLMSIATLGAFGIREYPEAVMVMILYQLGEYFQDKAVEKSRASISTLMDIRPDYANIEQNGEVIKVSPDKIKPGDVILVKTGEKIPLDGVVIDGQASVDTSALTGESVPREIKPGDSAISGCINTNGILRIKVEKEFTESTVSKILELVEHAGNKKAKTENFITRFAKIYTPIVVLGAVLLAIVPPLITGASFGIWFERALTFLVISCPCALVISVPLGFFAGIGGASRAGILVKGSCYLEALSKPYAIAFDKTGTLTKGSFEVQKVVPQPGICEDDLLFNAAVCETYSSHPIALSIKKACTKQVSDENELHITEISGKGIKAEYHNSTILTGNQKLMEEFSISFTPAEEIGTIVYTAKDGTYLGYITIADELKTDSQNAINQLKKLGIKTVMLTGDNNASAQAINNKLELDKVYSELLPADKVEKIESLINEKPLNKTVLFAGDGINDAPVLTRADVGIAMGALGSDAAIEAADVVIMDDKPSKIPTAIKIAKKTLLIVKQNIIFAIGIKIIFLILGAIGLMTMWGAVFADVGVTLLAVLNSLRALKIKSGN